MRSYLPARVSFVAASLALASCGQLISGYSLQAYSNATTLKADVASLVDDSTGPYADHTADIKSVNLKLHEAYEFSRGEAYNALSTQQWEILIEPAPQGRLYGAFLQSWMRHGKLNETEAGNWKTLLDRAFDYIICLEANKQSATACRAPEALPGQKPGAS